MSAFESLSVPIAFPDCVHVRMRHRGDTTAAGHVVGWFQPGAIPALLSMIVGHEVHFTEADAETDTDDVDVQVIAQGGVVFFEIVFGSGAEDE
jgi:hypothetical protein